MPSSRGVTANGGPTNDKAHAGKQRQIVLHRVANNSVDLFSGPSLRPVSDDALNTLAKLGDTDIVGVDDWRGYTQLRRPATRLADVSLPPRPPADRRVGSTARALPRPEPVNFLYYDAFSSFAPSYDSTGASSSYLASVESIDELERVDKYKKRRLNELDQRPRRAQSVEAEDDPLSSPVAKVFENKPAPKIDIKLAKLIGTTPVEFTKMFNSLPSNDIHSPAHQMLQHNNAVLRDLLSHQRQRLWQSIRTGDPEQLDRISDEEKARAGELLDSLAQAVTLSKIQPRDVAPENTLSKVKSALSAPAFHSLADVAQFSPAYQGLLDIQNATALPESAFNSQTQPQIQPAVQVKLTRNPQSKVNVQPQRANHIAT